MFSGCAPFLWLEPFCPKWRLLTNKVGVCNCFVERNEMEETWCFNMSTKIANIYWFDILAKSWNINLWTLSQRTPSLFSGISMKKTVLWPHPLTKKKKINFTQKLKPWPLIENFDSKSLQALNPQKPRVFIRIWATGRLCQRHRKYIANKWIWKDRETDRRVDW